MLDTVGSESSERKWQLELWLPKPELLLTMLVLVKIMSISAWRESSC
jgi:hypothetical protein